jgi:hypothetical protein
MRETSIGTSLLLIAAGAILAFGVTVQSSAIDINAIGAILLIVGLIGLIISFIFINDWSWIDDRRGYRGHDHLESEPRTPPHEHRQVERRDIIYEDDVEPDRVRRVRRVRR